MFRNTFNPGADDSGSNQPKNDKHANPSASPQGDADVVFAGGRGVSDGMQSLTESERIALLETVLSDIERRVNATARQQDRPDLLQIILIATYYAIDGWDRRASFRTWASAVARNICYTYLARRESPLTPLDLLDDAELEHISPVDPLAESERQSGFGSLVDFIRVSFPALIPGFAADRSTAHRQRVNLHKLLDHIAVCELPCGRCETCSSHGLSQRLRTTIMDLDLGRLARRDICDVLKELTPWGPWQPTAFQNVQYRVRCGFYHEELGKFSWDLELRNKRSQELHADVCLTDEITRADRLDRLDIPPRRQAGTWFLLSAEPAAAVRIIISSVRVGADSGAYLAPGT